MSAVREHLLAIHDKHGRLTPEIVVKEARPKKHPLHAHVFDRAPGEAAEAWYRHRAHELIRTVKITFAEDTEKPCTVRAFMCTRVEDGHVYEPVERVASDEFLRALVLRDMEREWKQLFKRYQDFEQFLSLVRADIEELAA